MPLRFKTEVKQSPIAGKGLFTLEFIPKGEVVWAWECQNGGIPTENYEAKQHKVYTKEQFLAITDEKQLDQLLTYLYYDNENDSLCLLGDAGRYINHSFDNHNCGSVPVTDKSKQAHVSIALRDINPGQQILQNYGNFPSYQCPWLWQIMKQKNKDRCQLQLTIQKLKAQQSQ